MFKRILIAISKPDTRLEVFRQGVDLAKAIGANLMLLHILSPFDQDAPTSPISEHIYDTLHEEALKGYVKRWQAYEQSELDGLKSLATEAMATGVSTEFSLNRGELGKTICELAHNWNADLIMLAGRQKNELQGLISGSATNYVAFHAPCSVILVHDSSTAG